MGERGDDDDVVVTFLGQGFVEVLVSLGLGLGRGVGGVPSGALVGSAM